MCAKTTILLWLAAVTACYGENTITIGDKEYTKTALIDNGATSRIVVNKGHVLYTDSPLHSKLHVVKLDTLESIELHGLDDIRVQDIAVDGAGTVWLATEGDGLYKMESVNSNATYVTGKDKDPTYVVVDNTNTVYAADGSEEVYVVKDNALHTVPGIMANSIATSNSGGVYYLTGAYANFVSKKNGIRATEVTKITIPGTSVRYNAWFVEVDKKTDALYILSYGDLVFYVPPGGTAAFQVGGLNETKAIGTDDQGNIYIGTQTDIYKLTPNLLKL